MTNINISLNKMLFIPLIFLWLQSCYIPQTKIPIYDIIIGIAFIFILIFIPKKLFSISNFTKYNFYKVLILYILWVFISGAVLVIEGIYAPSHYLYGVFLLFFYNNFTWFAYPYILYSRHYNLRYFIRFILISIYIICIWGLLIYILQKLNIHILEGVQQILNTRRVFSDFKSTRITSIFEEPGYFGSFICMNLPIIYNVILSKFRILKNKMLNLLFKRTYLPVIFITIILIQSPIWFVFTLLVTAIYFRKKIFNLKIMTIFMIIIISGLLYIRTLDIEKTFLNRIILTIQSFGNLEMLVFKEPSLASRIISYNIRLNIFKEHPITGVGYKNSEYVVLDTIHKIQTPLTEETRNNIKYAKNNFVLINGTLLYNSLGDTGIVGFLLVYLFIILSIIKAKQLTKLLPVSIERTFLDGLSNAYIVAISLSFYDLRVSFTYFWFLLGLFLCYIKYYQDNKKRFLINEQQEPSINKE